MAARPEPIECFAQAGAVLGGARLPLTAGASKVLRFMLERREGCDAWLTPDWFVVQYGWHLAHHRYYAEVAPPIVSWLLHEGGVQDAIERCAVVCPKRSLPRIDGFLAWSYDTRTVWIEAMPAQITLRIRDARSSSILVVPAPVEPPIEYLAGTWPCPHCHAQPERYRVLRGGAVVCLACGASSARPP
ncbi:MAG TPA: hypothetical protein VF469_08585 [Kofleriaceae bacterium]